MEYANSRHITEELALSINNQDLAYNVDTSNIKKKKDKIKCELELFYKNKLEEMEKQYIFYCIYSTQLDMKSKIIKTQYFNES